MRSEQANPVRLSDYRVPDHVAKTVHLDVALHPTATRVKAVTEIEADAPTGVETMKQAAAAGSTAAQLYLVGLYDTGESDITPEDARATARKAADAQDPKGMAAYAEFLFNGEGGARNRREALDWMLQAAERGLIDSQFNVAKLYENGDEGIPSNLADAFKWYLIAARAGDMESQEAVKRLTPQMSPEARAAARRAADAFQVEPLG